MALGNLSSKALQDKKFQLLKGRHLMKKNYKRLELLVNLASLVPVESLIRMMPMQILVRKNLPSEEVVLLFHLFCPVCL